MPLGSSSVASAEQLNNVVTSNISNKTNFGSLRRSFKIDINTLPIMLITIIRLISFIFKFAYDSSK